MPRFVRDHFKSTHIVPLGLLSALVLPLLLGACLERAQPSVADAPRPVQVVRVHLAPAADTHGYAGVIQARRVADIGFRTGGRIIERAVDRGAHVAAGQVLARLDPADLELSLRSAAADLASAKAQEVQAVADAERSASLLRRGDVAASVDDARQALARTARQRVASAEASLQLARNRLDYAVLRAPQDGVVIATLADPGTVVAEGAPVLRLADAGAFEAEIALPESALPDLAAAQASVGFWARPDIRLAARLRELAPQADPQLRTYTARFSIDDPPDWVALGMTATVTLSGNGGGLPVADLPAAALTDRGDGPMVWTVDAQSGRLSAHPVKIQALHDTTARVSGLEEGALVVSIGVQKLDPALKVRVADIRPAGV